MTSLLEELVELEKKAGDKPWSTTVDGLILIAALRNAFPAIVSALSDRDRVRAEALEEAARVCEARVEPREASSVIDEERDDEARACARAIRYLIEIRSLIAPPAEKK